MRADHGRVLVLAAAMACLAACSDDTDAVSVATAEPPAAVTEGPVTLAPSTAPPVTTAAPVSPPSSPASTTPPAPSPTAPPSITVPSTTIIIITTTSPSPVGDIGVEQPGSLRLLSASAEVVGNCDSSGTARVMLKVSTTGDVERVEVQVGKVTLSFVETSFNREVDFGCDPSPQTVTLFVWVRYLDGSSDYQPVPVYPY